MRISSITWPQLSALLREAEVPFQSIEYFVNTMRQASCDGKGKFVWPSPRYGMGKAIAAALHHLPVGHMVSIKNAQAIPAKYYIKNGAFEYTVLELYHGTSAYTVPQILGEGLRPTIGAGCEALENSTESLSPRCTSPRAGWWHRRTRLR